MFLEAIEFDQWLQIHLSMKSYNNLTLVSALAFLAMQYL